MRKKIDKIEIQDPAIKEFKTKKSSCIKRACAGSCGCFVLFGIVGIVFLYTLARPRTKELREIPKHFPDFINLYDTTAIETIQFSPHSKYGKLLNRLIKNPFVQSLRTSTKLQTRIVPTTEKAVHDTILIEWTELSAQPKFIAEYYETHLKKDNFIVTKIREQDTVREFRFVHSMSDVRGSLVIEDRPETPGTDLVRMTVLIPPATNE